MEDVLPNIDFLETLPFRGRLLVRRLESFGDIVVGFSISELALQLGLPKTPADLTAHPIKYVFFFGTFAFLALAWMRYHRMLTVAFAPGRIDLACAFAYLAFVALIPYALYATAQMSDDRVGAQYAIGAYLISLVGSSLAAFILSARSVGRAGGILEGGDLARLRQRMYIEGSIAIVLTLALATDIFFGARYSWTWPLLIPLVVRAVRSRIKAPGWTEVHVTGGR